MKHKEPHWITRLPIWLNVVAITAAELALVALMFLTVYAVVARYFFRSPSIYAMEISTYLLLVVAWGAVGWTHRVHRHVGVEALVVTLSAKWQRICDVVAQLAILVFCSVIFWSGVKVAITAYERNYRSASLLKFPLWVAYLSIPVGVFMLALIALFRLKKAHPLPPDSDEAL